MNKQEIIDRLKEAMIDMKKAKKRGRYKNEYIPDFIYMTWTVETILDEEGVKI